MEEAANQPTFAVLFRKLTAFKEGCEYTNQTIS